MLLYIMLYNGINALEIFRYMYIYIHPAVQYNISNYYLAFYDFILAF